MAVFARSGDQDADVAPWRVDACHRAPGRHRARGRRSLCRRHRLRPSRSARRDRRRRRHRFSRGERCPRAPHDRARAPWASSTVALVDGSRTWQTTNAALGIAPDIDAALAEALSYGKAGSVVDRLGAWIDAVRGQANIPFAMHAKGKALDQWVAARLATVRSRAGLRRASRRPWRFEVRSRHSVVKSIASVRSPRSSRRFARRPPRSRFAFARRIPRRRVRVRRGYARAAAS